MRSFTRTIPANGSQSFAIRGDTIFLQDTTGNLIVSARDDTGDGRDLLTRVTFREGSRQRTRGTFNQLRVENPSGSDIDATFIVGFGDYDEPPQAVLVQIPNGGVGGQVTANAAGTQLLAADATRKRAIVMVDPAGANGAFVAYSQADAVAGNGIPLEPGIGFPFETTAALWVARNGGTDVTVYFLTETHS